MQKFSQKRIKLFLIILFSTLPGVSISQSFSNNNRTGITDDGTVKIPILVSNLRTAIDTVSFGLESITVNIAHSANQELTLQLQSPDGTVVLLANNLPGKNYSNTTFNGTANQYIDFGSSPYSNNYRSIQDLSYLNNSQNPNGTWNLIVKDSAIGNIGEALRVSINFSNNPAKPLLSTSNLPIIKINTNGQEIAADPKIVADMVIIYNGPGEINNVNQTDYNYSGKIAIKYRGHGSMAFPKKQYAVETRDETGENSINVSLFGFSSESDWILSANYSDKPMMRNILAYQLARDMGNYASHTKYCEVIINNEYRGVFVFQEKIKRDKSRVNVEKMGTSDITSPNVTGGYIYSKDYIDPGAVTWTSKIPGSPTVYQIVYPKESDVQPEQKNYLQNYVDSFELALNGPDYQDPVKGFRAFADETSFMDYFLVNEVSKNIDGFRLSSYFHKARLGKIKAGPVWDFDIAWGNAWYDEGSLTTGFSYSYNYAPEETKVPFIWSKLMDDVAWRTAMNCRYSSYRGNILNLLRINNLIDSLANELQFAQQRNFTRWDIIGKNIWPNPDPVPTSYAGDVSYLKTWISERLSFLDSQFSACGAPLPVTMLNFEGVHTGNINRLTWTTTNELNNSYFIIERSINNQPFIQMGIVNSNNSNASINNYSFDDKKPQPGMNLYRLKQTDYDGSFHYSKIVSLGIEMNGWVISPNKVSNQLTLISHSSDNQRLTLNIYNMQGQLMKSEDVKNENIINQNVSTLLKGDYILQIIDSKGKHTSLRFLKD
jgi:subtilisin-like proprotein convertase family protein